MRTYEAFLGFKHKKEKKTEYYYRNRTALLEFLNSSKEFLKIDDNCDLLAYYSSEKDDTKVIIFVEYRVESILYQYTSRLGDFNKNFTYKLAPDKNKEIIDRLNTAFYFALNDKKYEKLVFDILDKNPELYEKIPEEYRTSELKEKYGHLGDYGFFDATNEQSNKDYWEKHDISVTILNFLEIPVVVDWYQDSVFKKIHDECVLEITFRHHIDSGRIDKILKDKEKYCVMNCYFDMAPKDVMYPTILVVQLYYEDILNKIIDEDPSLLDKITIPDDLKDKFGHLGKEYGFFDENEKI